MKSHLPILLLLALATRADADVGLYRVTKQNVAEVKEFSLQTRTVSDGQTEFRIEIPFDARIKKIKLDFRVWSPDMSKLLVDQPVDVLQRDKNGPWTAQVLVSPSAMKDGAIELFCIRNLPAETAYSIELATFAADDEK